MEDKKNPKPDSERKFASRIEDYANQNPGKVKEIVDDSEWGKNRNRQMTSTHTSLLDAWFGDKK